MPNVAFDLRANHDTGISRFGLSLLAEVAQSAVEAGWRLLIVTQSWQHERALAVTKNLGVSVATCPEEGFIRRSADLHRLLEQHDTDLYFTSHYVLDRCCPVPFVFTIHDLTELRLPQLSYTESSFARRFGPRELDLLRQELVHLAAWDHPEDSDTLFTRYLRAISRFLVERAKRVVTVSQSAAGDVKTMLNVHPSRLDIVPCAVNTAVFYPRDQSTVRAVRTRFGITGQYLVFVGLAHPYKRFPWLVEQLAREHHHLPPNTTLVAVGGHAERIPDLQDLLRRNMAEKLVVFTGHISDEHLAALYSGAAAYVTASVSEGYGLPPLEAMACGCQAIATDIPSLRETLGSAAHMYDPTDGEQLVALVGAALTGSLPDRARLFRPTSWSDSARATMTTLRRAMADTAIT